MNHSLTTANGKTHAKITLLALAVSLVFVAVVSAAGVTRSDGAGARAYGQVVKAPSTGDHRDEQRHAGSLIAPSRERYRNA